MYYSKGHIQINLLYNKNIHSSMLYASHTKLLPIEVSKIVFFFRIFLQTLVGFLDYCKFLVFLIELSYVEVEQCGTYMHLTPTISLYFLYYTRSLASVSLLQILRSLVQSRKTHDNHSHGIDSHDVAWLLLRRADELDGS